MILYEVNLTLDHDIAPEYELWLDGHIRDILALPGFLNARVFRADPPEGGVTGRVYYVIQYHLRTRADLESYFSLHAARFRQDCRDRFEGRFSAWRRIMELAGEYSSFNNP